MPYLATNNSLLADRNRRKLRASLLTAITCSLTYCLTYRTSHHLALSNFSLSKEDKMPKVRLNFSRLTATEKVARTRQIVEAMTTNSGDFHTPRPRWQT